MVSELLALDKIQVHLCLPNYPQSNGAIERFHSTLIEHPCILNINMFLKTLIRMIIAYAILAYNYSILTITKWKPIYITHDDISTNAPFDVEIDKNLVSMLMTARNDPNTLTPMSM